MVQEYKNTDLDLFQKIDLTNPKDELLKKNKIGSSQQENNNIKFNYLNHEISKFENLESHLSQDKSKKLNDILLNLPNASSKHEIFLHMFFCIFTFKRFISLGDGSNARTLEPYFFSARILK